LRLLISIIKFQLKKVVNRRNALVFLLIAAILQVFLQVGNANHNDIIESNETFQKQERQKVSRYLHHGQYGSFGIWLKFIPHSNNILYSDSTFDNLFCNADSTYVFNFYIPTKWRRLFVNRSRFLNFSVMFFLFGVLACLVYGMDAMVRKDYLKLISNFTGRKKAFWFTITARIIILFMGAIILYVISVLPLLVFDGINFFSTSFPILSCIILSFLFFFSIGCIIGLRKVQITRVLILGGVYILTVILLPWLMGLYAELSVKDLPPIIEYDFLNFNVLMNEEEKWEKKYGPPKSNEDSSEEEIKEFKEIMIKMKKIFRANEDSLRSRTLGKIKTQQTISSLFPTLFYFSVCENSSSTSINSFMDFHAYCQAKKEGFVDFNIDKTFPPKKEGVTKEDESASKKVENFIKADEDLFFAKPKLPYNFWLGVFLSIVYSILLLLLAFRIFKNRQISQGAKKEYVIETEKYNPVFSLCGNPEIKKDIVNFYRGKERTVVLEKINTTDFNCTAVKLNDLFRHLCRFDGIDEKKANENLALLGIRDLAGLSCCEDIIKKIYAAVSTAVDFDVIVIDDFLNKESGEFENAVFDLLKALGKAGKKIVYLSLHMKQDSARFFEKNLKIKEFKNFPFNFDNTSVR
jgi:hypothetical protein